MNNEVLRVISERRSIRGFKDTPVSKEQIDILIKAAMEAPSAKNLQPWHLIVITNKDIIAELNEASKIANKQMQNVFYGAPLVVIVSANMKVYYGFHDCGIAVQNMVLAAESIGLGSIILGKPRRAMLGECEDYYKKLLKIPETHKFVVAVEFGVPSKTKAPHKWLENRIEYIE
jgi:nitroreductase